MNVFRSIGTGDSRLEMDGYEDRHGGKTIIYYSVAFDTILICSAQTDKWTCACAY